MKPGVTPEMEARMRKDNRNWLVHELKRNKWTLIAGLITGFLLGLFVL